jgi:hypothetical protein
LCCVQVPRCRSQSKDQTRCSYWIHNLGFLLREKLAAIFIIPCYSNFPTGRSFTSLISHTITAPSVARRGATTRRPWQPSRPRQPPLLPPPPQPGKLGLPVTWVSRKNGGLAARRGAGGKPCQQRRPLHRHPTTADGHRAAKTRRPLLPLGPLPPTPRGSV